MVIVVVCSVILLILTGAAVVAVAAVLMGLRVRRWKKWQIARDSAVHYYSTPGPGYATVGGEGEGRKKESAAIDYYEDVGQGGGREGRKESAAIDYYEDTGRGGGGWGEVVANHTCGAAYQELQQSGLQEAPYTHTYSTCQREGTLDAVEHPVGGTSGTDNQPTYERVPGREPHYTALNMDTVTKSEYETLHKM